MCHRMEQAWFVRPHRLSGRETREGLPYYFVSYPSWTIVSVGFIERGQHNILIRKTRAFYQCREHAPSPRAPHLCQAIHCHELYISTHVSNPLHVESSSCSCLPPSKTSPHFSAQYLSPAQIASGFCHFSMPWKVPCYFQLLLPRKGKNNNLHIFELLSQSSI